MFLLLRRNCSKEHAGKLEGKTKALQFILKTACSLKAPGKPLRMRSGVATVFDGDESWTPLSTELI